MSQKDGHNNFKNLMAKQEEETRKNTVGGHQQSSYSKRVSGNASTWVGTPSHQQTGWSGSMQRVKMTNKDSFSSIQEEQASSSNIGTHHGSSQLESSSWRFTDERAMTVHNSDIESSNPEEEKGFWDF